MKDYINYMDSITVDPVLHEKIMSRLTKKPRPLYRSSTLYRYAGAAAGLIVLTVCFWVIPELLYTPLENIPDNLSTVPSVTAVPTITISPDVTGNEVIYPLLFNQVKQKLESDKDVINASGSFRQELSEEDFQNLLGAGYSAISKNHSVSGTSRFSGTGDLININFSCTNMTSGTETVIHIGKEPEEPDYLYSENPKTSNVNGISVVSGFWDNGNHTEYYSSFELGRISYFMWLQGDRSAEKEMTELVNLIISHGEADLSKIMPDYIPEWRDEELTLNEAKADETFGALVPSIIPNGFRFEASRRFLNQETNGLSLSFSDGNMGYLDIIIREFKSDDSERIIDPARTETYDLSLYPVPRAESVPSELYFIVNDPVFKIEDISLEIVNTRAYTINDAGDTPGYRMRFSVLCGDIVIGIRSKGAQPEEIYEMLVELGKQNEILSSP